MNKTRGDDASVAVARCTQCTSIGTRTTPSRYPLCHCPPTAPPSRWLQLLYTLSAHEICNNPTESGTSFFSHPLSPPQATGGMIIDLRTTDSEQHEDHQRHYIHLPCCCAWHSSILRTADCRDGLFSRHLRQRNVSEVQRCKNTPGE